MQLYYFTACLNSGKQIKGSLMLLLSVSEIIRIKGPAEKLSSTKKQTEISAD